jgi:uncharacterized membrane-anchored protein
LAGLIGLLGLSYWRFRWNSIAAFWSAYVLTRPLGASVADWLGKPSTSGGLGLGPAQVSLGLTILIAALVAYLATTRKDVQTGREVARDQI